MDSEEETLYGDVDSGNESSGDDVEMGVEATNPIERQPEVDEYPFEVLSTEEIVQYMVDSIKEVNTVVEIPATTTRILLNHFKWDKEKLMERFYDGDQDQLFSEARVINPFRKPSIITRPKLKLPRKGSATGTEECEICFSIFPSSMMTGLECGHRFCIQCWAEYLTSKIMEEGMGQTIACVAHGCEILVDDATVMALVRDSKVKLKYQHLITNSFVECNRLLRWCPSPDCNNAIKVQYAEPRPVTCTCSHTFCFACGENWHDPVKCHLLRKWIKKCDDDSETSNWIAANTKECPKCNVTIEKDGGCNHMVCKNQNCKADFCWVCLGPWEPHGSSWYNCNRYDEEEAKAARDAQERSRAALQRYLFYCNRYMNHMQSLKLEHKLYASVKEKMEEMQRHNMSLIEVEFLKKAVDILCQCRQTLMYTYVFAYYLKKNNQSVIFECNRLLRWCPCPDCNNAIKVQYAEWRPVTCTCSHTFCFACGENWHDPVKCHLLRKWIKKCDDDSETSNWIAANTKECPKCNVTIEKDGGCNHMVCKNQNCKADFCWVCLGPWEPHGSSWYNCNRYDEEEAKAARDAQERSRAALQRYLFYCNRYMNHMQSLKLEHKLYASVKEKMEEMQHHNMSLIEVEFLKKAVDILCQCRQTLMYTYVFAYYLKKNNQSVIFEDNQKDLESATETLSEYLERDITSENLADIKQKVQNKWRYCDGRRKALLEHVHEGYEKDWWEYTETS